MKGYYVAYVTVTMALFFLSFFLFSWFPLYGREEGRSYFVFRFFFYQQKKTLHFGVCFEQIVGGHMEMIPHNNWFWTRAYMWDFDQGGELPCAPSLLTQHRYLQFVFLFDGSILIIPLGEGGETGERRSQRCSSEGTHRMAFFPFVSVAKLAPPRCWCFSVCVIF